MSDREQIEALEQAEVAAILASDQNRLRELWHEDYLVNAPHNRLTTSQAEVIGLVAAGVIAYHRFDRVIEGVVVHGDTAIAMGHEIVQPKSEPQAGQVLTRRYSNIWHRLEGQWRMIARHANVMTGAIQNLDEPAD